MAKSRKKQEKKRDFFILTKINATAGESVFLNLTEKQTLIWSYCCQTITFVIF